MLTHTINIHFFVLLSTALVMSVLLFSSCRVELPLGLVILVFVYASLIEAIKKLMKSYFSFAQFLLHSFSIGIEPRYSSREPFISVYRGPVY